MQPEVTTNTFLTYMSMFAGPWSCGIGKLFWCHGGMREITGMCFIGDRKYSVCRLVGGFKSMLKISFSL